LNSLTLITTSDSYIYQGNEYGLENQKFKSIKELKDIDSLNFNRSNILQTTRDHARVPLA
jgi:glycosidase